MFLLFCWELHSPPGPPWVAEMRAGGTQPAPCFWLLSVCVVPCFVLHSYNSFSGSVNMPGVLQMQKELVDYVCNCISMPRWFRVTLECLLGPVLKFFDDIGGPGLFCSLFSSPVFAFFVDSGVRRGRHRGATFLSTLSKNNASRQA